MTGGMRAQSVRGVEPTVKVRDQYLSVPHVHGYHAVERYVAHLADLHLGHGQTLAPSVASRPYSLPS